MTKRDMVYEIAKATNTTYGVLVKAGKSVKNLDGIAKGHSLEAIEKVYKSFLDDKENALFYLSIL